MSFLAAEGEVRERFVDAQVLLSHIRQTTPAEHLPLTDLQKAMKGLWLVSLYAAFERSTNAIVEAAIAEVSSHGIKSIECCSPFQSILLSPNIQAVRSASANNYFDKSISLFSAAFSDTPIERLDNPLSDRMMNVDASTVQWLAGLFGISNFQVTAPDSGRLSHLRERRNAVSHGRERASQVGERFQISEMMNMYNAADRVCSGFLLAMKDHCAGRHYLRRAA